MANVVNSRPAIGIEGAVYCLLTESTDVTGGTPSYGTVKNLFPSAKLTVNPNGTVSTDWGDDGPSFVATTTGKIQVSLEAQDVDPAAYAEIMGQTRSNGITADSYLDTAPYVAFGYKQWLGGLDSLGNKVYRYKWLLKGKFSKSQEGGETKKETLNYQHMTIAGEFAKLNANGYYQTSIRTDASDVTSTTVTNWFTAPVISASSNLSAVTLSSGTGVASSHTITLTFGKADSSSFSIAAPNSGDVLVIDSTGAIVAGTYTYTPSVAGTSPTLAIVNSNIVAGSYTVLADNLHDINGVKVTQKSVAVTVS